MSKKLDKIDQRILYELDIKSDIPYSDLSHILKVPKETVIFRVKRLIQNGFIKNFRTTVHVSRLGYYYYKFFIKFQKTTETKEKEIIEHLLHSQKVAYLANLEGRYDITFLILVKNTDDLQHFINPFKSQFGEFILEQEVLAMTQVHRFNFRFFFDDGSLERDTYPADITHSNLDEIDYSIIRHLAHNSRENISTIAKHTKAHPNVIRYRIEKLTRLNVLGKPVLDIDFKKFNIEHYQVDLLLKDQTYIHKIIDFAAEMPESTFATVTLGKYDLALEFAVQDGQKIKEILNKIKDEYPDAIITSDTFVLNEHTANWFPVKPIAH